MIARTAFKKGHIPWNKGLTKEDPRVAKYIARGKKFIKGQRNHPNWYKALKEGRIKAPGGWNKNLPAEKQPGYKGGKQKSGNGYIYLLIPGHPFADKRGRVLEHRIIYEKHSGRYLQNGEYIDHINGNRTDNRIENLRICTWQENHFNKKIQSNNKSGYPGVYLNKKNGKYHVQITVRNKTIAIGHFDNKEDAINARKKAEKEYFGKFARIN